MLSSIQTEIDFNFSFNKNVIDIVRTMPKIDLHRHLLGSVRVKTVYEIYKKNGIDFPYLGKNFTIEDVRNRIVFTKPTRDLKLLIRRAFSVLNKIIISKDVVKRIVFEATEDAHKDNVNYVEFLISPYGLNGNNKIDMWEFLHSIEEGKKIAEKKYPDVEVNFILSVPRHYVGKLPNYKKDIYYRKLLEGALFFKNSFVLGIDLTGDEEYSPFQFSDFFKKAKNNGLKITVHAGENGSINNIKTAIFELQADRIGHGISLLRDKELLNYVAKKGITLETCITSNYITGVVQNIMDHPIKKFFDEGVSVTLNTDDPIVFKTTISQEIIKSLKYLNFSFNDIIKMMYFSIDASFTNNVKKQIFREKLHNWENKIIKINNKN